MPGTNERRRGRGPVAPMPGRRALRAESVIPPHTVPGNGEVSIFGGDISIC